MVADGFCHGYLGAEAKACFTTCISVTEPSNREVKEKSVTTKRRQRREKYRGNRQLSASSLLCSICETVFSDMFEVLEVLNLKRGWQGTCCPE